MKKWNEYKLIIFDMDGTLYFQRPVQICMGMQLLGNAVFSKTGLRELKTTMQYRRLREEWNDTQDSLKETGMEEAQFVRLAQMTGYSDQEAYEVISKWIYTRPLKVLPWFKDRVLIAHIKDLVKENIPVVIYSDYPARDKAKALGLEEIPCFYGGQKEINCMKPSPRGIEKIALEYGDIRKEEILLVGDRMSKDGEAALAAGVDYLILKKGRFGRRRQYRHILDH